MISQSHRQARRILVVDDETLVSAVVARGLQLAGYDVGTADGGEAGLRRFQEGGWDVVVTDRAMPSMNGVELAAAIKAVSPATPVILMTGLANVAGDEKVFARIFRKPFRMQDLAEAIEECITGG